MFSNINICNPQKKVETIQDVVLKYNEIEKKYRYSISFYDDVTNFAYIRGLILDEFLNLGYTMDDICDTLVIYLFHKRQSKRKNVFWMCFGDIVYRNLLNNIPKGSIQCRKCGERFVPATVQKQLCDKCATYQPASSKVKICVDCGKSFEIAGYVKNKKRCDECQKSHDKVKRAERNARYYANHKD